MQKRSRTTQTTVAWTRRAHNLDGHCTMILRTSFFRWRHTRTQTLKTHTHTCVDVPSGLTLDADIIVLIPDTYRYICNIITHMRVNGIKYIAYYSIMVVTILYRSPCAILLLFTLIRVFRWDVVDGGSGFAPDPAQNCSTPIWL